MLSFPKITRKILSTMSFAAGKIVAQSVLKGNQSNLNYEWWYSSDFETFFNHHNYSTYIYIYTYSFLESTCSFYSKKHSTRFQTKYRNESESIRKLIPSGSSYSREYKVWKLSTEIVREEWQDGVWLSYCFSFIWNHSIWESLSPSECKCVNKTSSC